MQALTNLQVEVMLDFTDQCCVIKAALAADRRPHERVGDKLLDLYQECLEVGVSDDILATTLLEILPGYLVPLKSVDIEMEQIESD